MKVKALVLLLILFYVNNVKAQDSTKVEDFKIPSTPGFSLLDLSPSTIQRPSSSKALALTLLNAAGTSGVLPKDFALEVTPYWLIKLKNETFYKYSNIYDGKRHNTFSGILRKLSFSISTHFNDSTQNFLPNTNYVSFGLKTNLLTMWGRSETEKMEQNLTRYKNIARDVALIPGLTPQQRVDSIFARQERIKTSIVNFSKLRPLFQLDFAYAAANMFADNKYENRKFYKKAAWLNASFSVPVNKGDYLHAILYGRLGDENILIDTVKNIFNRNSMLDYGIKVEYEKDKFSLAFEYIKRKYKDLGKLDGERAVGILQYKIDNNLMLFGTYGKNFPNLNNLFTSFGINWSFGSKSLLSKPTD
jgi:hypothetical protein